MRSSRRKRTERRCAHVSVLQFLLAHLDLVGMQCLVLTPGGLKPPSVAYIAEHTGLALRRTENVLAELVQAGYLRTMPQHEKVVRADGSIEILNHVAIRWLTPRLLEDLGLGVKLTIERKRARARRAAAMAEQRAAQPDSHPLSHVLAGTTSEGRRGRRRAGVGQTRPAGRQSGPSTEHMQLIRLAAAEKAQHPDWDREACYAAARRRLGIEPAD